MRKFILEILIFIIGILFLDMILGYLLSSQRPSDYDLFLKSKQEYFKKPRNYDILIIGDSHIADAIDPRTIRNELSLNAYNLGIYHASPYENYYLTKAALENTKSIPNILVLGTNPVMFERELSKGKYTPLIIPYRYHLELAYHSHEGLDITLVSRTIREKYLFRSILNNLLGRDYQPTRVVQDVYNGHLKFFNQINELNWINEEVNSMKINQDQVNYFIKTIELAQGYGIPVIIVHSPIWNEQMDILHESESYSKFSEIINTLAYNYSLQVFTLGDNELSALEKKDFLNAQHLNYSGSQEFTTRFTCFLERFMKGSH
jgi:hypothetical protein